MGERRQIGTLIVDDDQDIRRLIRLIVEAADKGLFVSAEASNGREALDLLDEADPQVIVLDQMMPGLTGLETAEQIALRRPGQAIVLCTAYLDENLIEDAGAVGIQTYLPKERFSEIPAAIRSASEQGSAE